MSWWIWIIIVSVALGAIATVITALRRKRPVEVDREGISKIEAGHLQVELEASRAAERSVTAEKEALQTKLKQNQAWYNNRLQANKKETGREEDRLATDRDALDRRLDELLDTGDKEDSG